MSLQFHNIEISQALKICLAFHDGSNKQFLRRGILLPVRGCKFVVQHIINVHAYTHDKKSSHWCLF